MYLQSLVILSCLASIILPAYGSIIESRQQPDNVESCFTLPAKQPPAKRKHCGVSGKLAKPDKKLKKYPATSVFECAARCSDLSDKLKTCASLSYNSTAAYANGAGTCTVYTLQLRAMKLKKSQSSTTFCTYPRRRHSFHRGVREIRHPQGITELPNSDQPDCFKKTFSDPTPIDDGDFEDSVGGDNPWIAEGGSSINGHGIALANVPNDDAPSADPGNHIASLGAYSNSIGGEGNAALAQKLNTCITSTYEVTFVLAFKEFFGEVGVFVNRPSGYGIELFRKYVDGSPFNTASQDFTPMGPYYFSVTDSFVRFTYATYATGGGSTLLQSDNVEVRSVYPGTLPAGTKVQVV